VARPFDYILRRLRVGWPDVAYTNASKSQAVPGAEISQLIRACGERFPIDRLASTLDASSIVVCSAPVHALLLAQGVTHEYFKQQGWSYQDLDAIAQRCHSRLPHSLR